MMKQSRQFILTILFYFLFVYAPNLKKKEDKNNYFSIVTI